MRTEEKKDQPAKDMEPSKATSSSSSAANTIKELQDKLHIVNEELSKAGSDNTTLRKQLEKERRDLNVERITTKLQCEEIGGLTVTEVSTAKEL